LHTLHLKSGREGRIRGGHLWAFAGEIREDLTGLQPGEAVALCEARGRLLGRGYVNPHSLIAVRLLTKGEEEWDDGLFLRRFQEASFYRDKFCPQGEARREVFSESDGLPGLIVDRYGEHLVIQSLTAGIECRLDQITNALVEVYRPAGILLSGRSKYRRLEGLTEVVKPLFGNPQDEIPFDEDLIHFIAYPLKGQKTGFFLDQRANRQMLIGFSHQARVLDLYCYTGAWGITALKAGAREAVFVDSSATALEWAAESAQRNGVASRCSFFKADAGDFLKEAANSRETFDMVIVDPPALIGSSSAFKTGRMAYQALNRAALKVTAKGGILISCSCSHLMGRGEHLALIGEAAMRENRRLRLICAGRQPPDHPILPGHPETEYLKCWMIYCE